MPKLPRPTGQEMVRFLKSQGFAVVRIRGSHHVMARLEARTSVPVHGSELLRIGTLRGILRDIDLSGQEFAPLDEGLHLNPRDAIVSDPEVMHGAPVFRGTRVPVQTLFDYLENGVTLDDFLEGFPTISRELAMRVLDESKGLRLTRV